MNINNTREGGLSYVRSDALTIVPKLAVVEPVRNLGKKCESLAKLFSH